MKRRESRLRGKKVRVCRKAVLLWDEGLSYPLKHICVCSSQKDVVYESRCRCLYMYLAVVQRGGRCDSDGVSQCLGAGGSRTDLVSIPFLEMRRVILCSGEMIECFIYFKRLGATI